MANLSGVLERVTSGKKKRPRRVMVYGIHGVGKSTFASQAPEHLFLDFEDGLDDIDCTKTPHIKAFDDLLAILSSLYTTEHKFKTVIIDSLDWLERVIWDFVCKDANKKNIEEFGYGKGYQVALGQWRRVIAALDSLRYKKKMATILVAHSKIEKFESPETESYDRYVPRLHKLACGLVTEWCDEIFFATYKVFTRKIEEGFGRERTQAIGTGDRIVRTTEQPYCMAKSRAQLPEEFPLDWNCYMDYLKNGTGKERNDGESERDKS